MIAPDLLKNSLLLLVFLLAGCGLRGGQSEDQAPEVLLQLATTPEPAKVGPGQIYLTLADRDGNPISDARIELRGDMSHAGMVPVLSTAEATDQGGYLAEFDWSMAGDWILTITAELPDGRRLIRNVNLNVIGMSHEEMGQ